MVRPTTIGTVEKKTALKFDPLSSSIFECQGVSTDESFAGQPSFLLKLLKYYEIENRVEVEKVLRFLNSSGGVETNPIFLEEKLSKALAKFLIKVCEPGYEKFISIYLNNNYNVKCKLLYQLEDLFRFAMYADIKFDQKGRKAILTIGKEKNIDLWDCHTIDEAPPFVIIGKKIFAIDLFDKYGEKVTKEDFRKAMYSFEQYRSWDDIPEGSNVPITIILGSKEFLKIFDFGMVIRETYWPFEPQYEDQDDALTILCKVAKFLKKVKEPIIWCYYDS